MMRLLDTNVCIRLLNGSDPKLSARLRAESHAALFLSAVTKAELLYGARHSQRIAANLKLLELFFAPFASLPFDDRCAEHYGIIRAALSSRGEPIGPNDLLIAATALAHGLTLVTHNTKEFSRVPELEIEDWE